MSVKKVKYNGTGKSCQDAQILFFFFFLPRETDGFTWPHPRWEGEILKGKLMEGK